MEMIDLLSSRTLIFTWKFSRALLKLKKGRHFDWLKLVGALILLFQLANWCSLIASTKSFGCMHTPLSTTSTTFHIRVMVIVTGLLWQWQCANQEKKSKICAMAMCWPRKETIEMCSLMLENNLETQLLENLQKP